MRPVIAAWCAASLYILASAAPVLADTSGLVRGMTTVGGKPTPGVTLTLRGEENAFTAVSGPGGTFTFARVPFGRYTLTAHKDGVPDYTQSIDVETDAVVNLPIDLQLKVIGNVQSVTSRGAGSQPVSVNSIGREQLAALPENQSLDNVIETLPGIVRFSYNEPVAHGFHGLTYELDGVPLPQSNAANFSEIIDPRTIDSLEVFTGAFPAEFGGSRQGAVVNIISHRSSDLTQPEAGSFTLGAGSYGDLQSTLTETARFGATQLFFNADQSRTNRGIDAPTFVPVHDNSNVGDEFLRTITNVGKNDTLTFDASNSTSIFQIPINDTPNINDPIVSLSNTDDVQREYSNFFNLVYTHNASDGQSYTQVAPWYKYDRIVYAGDTTANLAAGNPGLDQDRKSFFEGLRLTHFHVFGDNAVKLGLDDTIENFSGFQNIAYNEDADGNPIPVQTFASTQAQRGSQVGAYVEDKWTPTRYFAVQGGLRYDHSTGYVGGSQVSPRLEVDDQVDPQDIIHAFWGRLYAAPFLEDVRAAAVALGCAGSSSSNCTSALPPYDLKPERDQYYEFGLAHSLTPDARATINFWKRNVVNVLDTTQLANTPIFAVYNSTIGIAEGVEGRVDAHWHDGDSLFFSASLSNSNASAGVSGGTFLICPTLDPTCLSNNGVGSLTLQPEDHDQTFASEIGYTKRLGADRTYFATIEPQYGTGYPVAFLDGSQGRLPPHLTLDASFGRDASRGAHRHLGFVATFTNFTDTKYLLKIQNGFNTTQWGPGFRSDFRVVAPF
jgi:outer membrane receptor for ferrienterochelin and colicin